MVQPWSTVQDVEVVGEKGGGMNLQWELLDEGESGGTTVSRGTAV